MNPLDKKSNERETPANYTDLTDEQILAEARKKGFVAGNGFYTMKYPWTLSDSDQQSARELMKKATQAAINQGNPAGQAKAPPKHKGI
ncbi:MAG: hypothetical protein FWC26_01250 [Fibromonadales bacterium]|nr:hypothetical protein [Fibromonadales bacterium]